MRIRRVLLLLAAVTLVACPPDPDANDRADGPNPETEVGLDEDADPTETPLENLDDCAEVSAAEGAPAGITMMDNFFEPPCLAVSSTQEIALTNAGTLDHTFTVADQDIDIEVEPGEEASTDEVGTDLAAGTYRFYCRYHEAQAMVGTLVVE